jgi:hypothetical protein
MTAFEDAGIALEDVARAAASGELSFPLGLFLPEPVALSANYEELAASLGRPAEFLRRLSSELGLPPGEDDRLRGEDAEMLSLLLTKLDLADDGELSRFARLYGGTVQSTPGSSSSTRQFAGVWRHSTLRPRRGPPSVTSERRGSPNSSPGSFPGCRAATGSAPSSSTSST